MAVPYTFGNATTSIPLSQLDSNFATTITLGNTAIQLGNTVTTLNNMTLANVTISSGTSNLAATAITNGTSNVTIASSGGNISMATNGATAITVDTSQNVGIGVVPNAWNSVWKALQIGNRTAIAQTTSDTLFTNNAYYDSVGWKYQITQYSSGIAMNANNGQVKIITAPSGTAGNAITFTDGPYVANLGTSWTSSSDERLKTITGEIANGLTKVCSLRAAEFTWKYDQNNKPCVGLIAQDVQAVLPEVINTNKKYNSEDETEYLGVNYTETIPLLVAAIKELKAINDTQAETINALTARIVALEAK